MGLRAFLAAAAAAAAAAALAPPAPPSPELTFRPPAVPLFVSSPFTSIWSFDAFNLASSAPNFWNGEVNTLLAIARVDGKAFNLVGQPLSSATPAAQQQGLPIVTSTSSYYTLNAGGVRFDLRFTTPQLPGDLEVMSRPASYLTFTATPTDGASHSVQLFYGQGADMVTTASTDVIAWDRPDVPGATALRMGLQEQLSPAWNATFALQNNTEPHQQAEYGWAYALAATPDARLSSLISTANETVSAFLATGTLPGPSADAPSPAAQGGMLSAFAWDLGSVGPSSPANVTVVFAVDEVVAMAYYNTPLSGYWRRAYPAGDATVVPAAPLAAAVADAESILAAAAALDATVAAALTASAGPEHAAVAQLTYRQVYGANTVVWNGSAAHIYQKEISSDGDLSTLDVIFPSSPQPLWTSQLTTAGDIPGAYPRGAEILAATIEPHLFLMGGDGSPIKYTMPAAWHSLGKWPYVTATNGGDSMPMETTGDLTLMTALAAMAGNGSMAQAGRYMPLLRRFAVYCADSLPFPAFQDMTDDFSHAPGNLTNLALKCINAIGAVAYLEQLAGNATGSAALYAQAAAFGEGFASLGFVQGQPAPHFKFIYNETWDDSYGLMYNAVWLRLLGMEWLVPSFYPLFRQHYDFLGTVKVNATWCVPLDSRLTNSKWDWLTFTAALMYSNGSATAIAGGSAPGALGAGAAPAPTAWSQQVFSQLFTFANTTTSRSPLTDHPECVGPVPTAAADRARPVMGAMFAPLLVANPPPAFTAQHALVRAAAEAAGIDSSRAWAPLEA